MVMSTVIELGRAVASTGISMRRPDAIGLLAGVPALELAGFDAMGVQATGKESKHLYASATSQPSTIPALDLLVPLG